MRFDVLTVLPAVFETPLKQGVIGRAISKGVLTAHIHNLRDFTGDKHRTTDDYPYGGGPGMVMKVEPVVKAIESLPKPLLRSVILTSASGVPLNDALARELSNKEQLVIVCGRYEGVDERIAGFVDLEVSVGDYVLSGGEFAALVIIDAVGRLIPGVLGSGESSGADTFVDGLLEYPQYTRPDSFRGMDVPDALLSGNHAEIGRWRRRESLRRTLQKRPDLLVSARLSNEDWRMLEEIKKESVGAPHATHKP